MSVRRLIPWALILLGGAGMATLARTGAAERFWGNWILWFLFADTVALGCLFLVALEHLVGAVWSVPLRRVPERLATLLLPVLPMALAALWALPLLYPGAAGAKGRWLAPPWVALRTLGCWALMALALGTLVGGSLRQDRDGGTRFKGTAPAVSAGFALTITLLAFDWLGALTPSWYSDLFGAYLFAGAFLAALAATTLGVLRLRGQGRLPGVRDEHLHNLGGLLFAFTVFWGYLAFSQYLLSWYGNLPDEAHWYRLRLAGPWRQATWALALLHFALPFLVLLPRDAKRAPSRLRAAALVLLAAHYLELHWLVFPALNQGLGQGLPLAWPEASFAAFFLGWLWLWLRRAGHWGRDLPVGDPLLARGLDFRL